jgi:hypothetical protein
MPPVCLPGDAVETILFGLLHYSHDPRVPRIYRQLFGYDRQGRISVDRAGEHLRAGNLGNLKRLSGQVRFVHHSMTLDHCAIHGADLMRENNECLADGDFIQPHIRKAPRVFAVSYLGHAPGESIEH